MKLIGVLFTALLLSTSASAETRPYFLTVYGAQMTNNHWDDFFGTRLDFADSYLLTVALAKRLGGFRDYLSYEVEGQLVKHFHEQDHWEFNALATLRWEKFFWDKWLDTSVAFGLGPSYATEKPPIEVANDGDSAKFLLYWMMELAIVPLKRQPQVELLTRIHHRSNGYGLFAEEGGSNALACGVRYRF